MTTTDIDSPSQSDLRAALAALSYDRDEVRIADADLAGYDWLVASSKGVFAVSLTGCKTAVFGWYFGICLYRDTLYLFENCGHKDRAEPRGRLVQMALRDGRLSDPRVIATGLDCRCHQIAVIDELLHVLDTANQTIRRYDLDGALRDILSPFAPPMGGQVAGYHHINAIADADDRIAVMLHNGRQLPEVKSELAWFDYGWQPIDRQPMPGYGCHDIVGDGRGLLWHSDSMTGDIVASNGRRVDVSAELMTRGIAFSGSQIIVGLSIFGPRYVRDKTRGAAAIFDRDFNRLGEVELPGAPADIISLP